MNYFITANAINLHLNKTPYKFESSHKHYQTVLNFVKAGDEAGLTKFLESLLIKHFLNGQFYLKNSKFYTATGEELPATLEFKLVALIQENLPVEPLLNLYNNIQENPSFKARKELLGWIEATDLPITQEGCVLAYKAVRHDYLDIHSGTISNTVGAVVTMPRRLVDDDSNTTCSTGLHVANYDYVKGFGSNTSRIMVIKIHPRDFVAIPVDYNNVKARVCRYEVIEETSNDSLTNKLLVD